MLTIKFVFVRPNHCLHIVHVSVNLAKLAKVDTQLTFSIEPLSYNTFLTESIAVSCGAL